MGEQRIPGIDGTGVIVTGAASGIGRGAALLAARSGASVVAGDRNDALLADLDVQAKEEGLAIRTVHLDVGSSESISAFVAAGSEAGSGLYGVVHAAAVAVERPSLDIDPAFWDDVLRINLTGTFVLAREAGRVMIARGTGGSIVNVASAAAVAGSVRLAPYTATKAGVVALGKSLAQEWGPLGIRVNTVSPGAVDTPLYHSQPTRRDTIDKLPLPRIGTPEDIALAIGFFLGDQSPWITGQNLNVNGGALMI
ncbi:SDR family NAD(P)-dependent oxidoreductase [Pseudonocardia sp. CA-107938]|uniref:SDR family NAD(P)-dependent oxidoreductase n=1 Tax=Pseudonocardia sp. CA-107938 TaxID=3240021 RepID=UPI003D915A03